MHATEAGLLRREVTALMFDQYGTVVDMQGGLTGDGDAVPGRQGPGPTTRTASSPGGAARTFEHSMIDSLCDRGHTSYRQIGHRAVSQVMRRAGIDHTHDEVRRLVSCIERLKPFPDVLEALGRLHERYRLDDRGIRPQRARIIRYSRITNCARKMYTASGGSHLND